MMLLNATMERLLSQIQEISYHPFPEDLEILLSKGIILYKECVILKGALSTIGSDSIESFMDSTGFECFTNHMHLDDYETEDIKQVALGLEIIKRINVLWNDFCLNGTLRIILCVSENGSTIRFHLARENESWIDSDIDKYREDSVLICDLRNSSNN